MQPPGGGPDGIRSQAQYRRRAPFYDAELVFFEPVRRAAIAQLALQPGESVIDVGCGTGLSFEGLLRGVGPRGRVIGLDPSPEMLERARRRVAARGWRNVELVQGFAADASLHGKCDAALFLFTHDVLRDERSLAHVLRHLKAGARVVAAGLQWAPPWLVPANAFVMLAALYSVTSLEGLNRPWDKLAARLRDLEVRNIGLGGIYLAGGRLA